MKTLIFQHPNTVSSVSVDGDRCATSCFDGFARRWFIPVAGSSPELTVQGAVDSINPQSYKQLNTVAIRGDLIAYDDGFKIEKEGLAITAQGYVVRPSDFAAPSSERITAISKDGRYAVCTDLNLYDRFTGSVWPCVTPYNRKYTPMAVEVLPNGVIVVGSLDGYVRFFKTPTDFQIILPSPAGVCALDISADGKRLVCADWDRGVSIYDAVSLMLMARTSVATLPHGVRFYGYDVLIGTHGGELLRWDGQVDTVTTPTQTPTQSPSKPGRRNK